MAAPGPGYIPIADTQCWTFSELLDLGGEYIDGVLWLPYAAVFPLGSTLDRGEGSVSGDPLDLKGASIWWHPADDSPALV